MYLLNVSSFPLKSTLKATITTHLHYCFCFLISLLNPTCLYLQIILFTVCRNVFSKWKTDHETFLLKTLKCVLFAFWMKIKILSRLTKLWALAQRQPLLKQFLCPSHVSVLEINIKKKRSHHSRLFCVVLPLVLQHLKIPYWGKGNQRKQRATRHLRVIGCKGRSRKIKINATGDIVHLFYK